MLKKMRWRFIQSAMAAFTAVILALLCVMTRGYAALRVRQAQENRMALEAAAAAEREHERRTRDRVRPGEQQPEVEHDMSVSQNSDKGYHNGRHWRHGSWFAYTLDPKGAKGELSVEAMYWGDDRGRVFDVLANGVVIGQAKLEGRHHGNFYTETYPIPTEVAKLRTDGKVRVTFAATNGGLAGGVFDVRLLAN